MVAKATRWLNEPIREIAGAANCTKSMLPSRSFDDGFGHVQER